MTGAGRLWDRGGGRLDPRQSSHNLAILTCYIADRIGLLYNFGLGLRNSQITTAYHRLPRIICHAEIARHSLHLQAKTLKRSAEEYSTVGREHLKLFREGRIRHDGRATSCRSSSVLAFIRASSWHWRVCTTACSSATA